MFCIPFILIAIPAMLLSIKFKLSKRFWAKTKIRNGYEPVCWLLGGVVLNIVLMILSNFIFESLNIEIIVGVSLGLSFILMPGLDKDKKLK